MGRPALRQRPGVGATGAHGQSATDSSVSTTASSTCHALATPTTSRPGSSTGANGGSTDSTAVAVPPGSTASNTVLSTNAPPSPANSHGRGNTVVHSVPSTAKPSTYHNSPVPSPASSDPGTVTTPAASATTVPSTPIAARCASPVMPRPARPPSSSRRGRSTVSSTSAVPSRSSSIARRAARPANRARANATSASTTTPIAIRWPRFGSVTFNRVRLICAWSTLDSTSCGRTPSCAICASSTCCRTSPFSVVRSCGSSRLSTVTCNAARAPDTSTSSSPARTSASPAATLSTWLTVAVTPRLAVAAGNPSDSEIACPARPTRIGRTPPNTNACRRRKTTSDVASTTEPTSTGRDHTRARNSRRATRTASLSITNRPPRRTTRPATCAAA